jgi:hypothetical protein
MDSPISSTQNQNTADHVPQLQDHYEVMKCFWPQPMQNSTMTLAGKLHPG